MIRMTQRQRFLIQLLEISKLLHDNFKKNGRIRAKFLQAFS